MNILNSRHSAILQYLLEHAKPVSAESIGNSIGTSARVIRQNIPTINRWLKSYGVEIECKPNFGILLACPTDVKTKIIEIIHNQNKEKVYSLKDRQQLILFELLSKSNQFSESKLRNQLNISKSTLSNDLDRMEKWLNDKDLFLSRRPRIGITIQGRENDIRHALITLLYESGLEAELIRLALWEVKKQKKHFYMLSQSGNFILSELANWRLSSGWNFISIIENELNAKFADGDHLSLTLYWVIANLRIKQNHFIQLSDERIHYLSTRPEYKVVQDIVKRIIKINYVSISEAEIAQFTLEIMTSRGTFSNLDEDQNINPRKKHFALRKNFLQKSVNTWVPN